MIDDSQKPIASSADATRRRGRPRAEEPHSVVSTWLSAKEHDALIDRANRSGKTVSATVREILLDKT